MLHKLAGRLTWEQMPQGIRVEIPAPHGTFAFLYIPTIVIWSAFALIHYWRLLDAPRPEDNQLTLQWIAIGIYVVGFCFFLCWLAFSFTRDTVLSLDPSEMKIQRRALGIELVSRSFPASQVSQVLYITPGKYADRRSFFDPNTSKIQFYTGDKPHSFASGITELEACALILLMLEVCKFPGSYAPIVTGE